MKIIQKLLLGFGLLSLVACASGSSNNDSAAQEAYVKTENSFYGIADYDVIEEEMDFMTGEENEPVLNQEKLVYSGSLSIETLNYEDCLKELRNHIRTFQGIIEYEEEYDNDRTWYYSGATSKGTRSIYLIVRIPTDDFYRIIEEMEGMGKIINRTTSVENITRAYYNNATEIEALEKQESRLLEMMEKAQTIEDMIEVERRLTEVQRDLSLKKNQQNSMDTDVKYSTIHINLKEVLEYSPDYQGQKTGTFFDRLNNTLKNTWGDFLYVLESILFFLIRLIPYVVIFGPMIYFYRKYRKQHPRQAKTGNRKPFFSKKKEDETPVE